MSDECQLRLVSVIVPTYNRARLLGETMDSVWGQTYRPIELLVVDDGSGDNTEQSVADWGTQHARDSQFTLRYFKQPNRGASAARNLGLVESRGEFIQFLDSDDLLHPEKIAGQLESCKSWGVTVYGDCRRFALGSKRILVYSALPRNRPERALQDWFEGRFVAPAAFLWRREDVRWNGPWDERVSPDDDGEFARRFLLRGGQWKHCLGTWEYYRTYTDLRPRVCTTATVEALKTLLSVLDATERSLAEMGLLNDLRKSFARQFWNLAKQAALVPEVRKEALARYRRLDPRGRIPEHGIDRVLYRVLGIGGRKRFVTFLRRLLGLQPFRPIGTVKSIADLYSFDLPYSDGQRR